MSSYNPVDYLSNALNYYTKREIADELDVNVSTITRWLKSESEPKDYVIDRLQKLISQCTTKREITGEFSFIDLFAGIGGIRNAFEKVGGECVFTSEWDSFAQKTYAANYRDGELLNGDITKIEVSDIPDHDILLAGFPCQPFSIAGVSKKNSLGRLHGFEDETQGTLFFDVARIIDKKRPEAFVLENVKNLTSHDKGNTIKVIMRTLKEELGYNVFSKVIDGQHWVPQHRERIIIIGFKSITDFNWDMLNFPPKGKIKIGAILHKTDGREPILEQDADKYFNHDLNKVHDKYTLTDNLWTYLQNYAAKHKALGNGFGFGLVTEKDVSRTLSARYYKDGSEILIYQEGKNPRRLTPRECARLMGFDDNYIIPVSDTRAYKQFGNSVIVPVFTEVAKAIKPLVLKSIQRVKEPALVS